MTPHFAALDVCGPILDPVLKPGQTIALCVLALLTIGVVMVSSAGMSVGGDVPDSLKNATVSILLSRSAIYMFLALSAMVFCSRLPIQKIASLATHERVIRGRWGGVGGLGGLCLGTAALMAVLAMVYIPFIAYEAKGAHRWIMLNLPVVGGLSIQPSELAKWGIIILLAWYGAVRAADMRRFKNGLLPGLAAVGLIAGFIILEDLGTGVLIGAVSCIVLLAAGARLWHFFIFAPPVIAGLVLAIVTSPYRVRRLVAFVDPYADPQGVGYHMIQSMSAVAGGEGFGRGLGHGLQKFGYLPEDRTDFLFAIICEELGIAGATVVIGIFVILLWSGVSILRQQTVPILKLCALGVIATVGLQACINLTVVTGLGPTKGIALPLVSSGGTGWILTAASLGLLMAMDRTVHLAQTLTPPITLAEPLVTQIVIGKIPKPRVVVPLRPQHEATVGAAERP